MNENAIENFQNVYEQDDMIMEIMYQACGYYHKNIEKWVIDNECTSTYEAACEYLEWKGYLKKFNNRIYEIVKMEQ